MRSDRIRSGGERVHGWLCGWGCGWAWGWGWDRHRLMAIYSNGVQGIKSVDSFNGPRKESPPALALELDTAKRICLCGESTHPRPGSMAGRCEHPKLWRCIIICNLYRPGVLRGLPRRPGYRVTCWASLSLSPGVINEWKPTICSPNVRGCA